MQFEGLAKGPLTHMTPSPTCPGSEIPPLASRPASTPDQGKCSRAETLPGIARPGLSRVWQPGDVSVKSYWKLPPHPQEQEGLKGQAVLQSLIQRHRLWGRASWGSPGGPALPRQRCTQAPGST